MIHRYGNDGERKNGTKVEKRVRYAHTSLNLLLMSFVGGQTATRLQTTSCDKKGQSIHLSQNASREATFDFNYCVYRHLIYESLNLKVLI